MKTFKCNKCGVIKSTDKFPKDKKVKRGFSGICKECKRKRERDSYYKRKEGYSYCKYCDSWFEGEGETCSIECEEHKNELNKTFICKECGKEFKYKHNTKNHFCSRACADNYISTIGKAEFINYKKTECDYCEKELKYFSKKLRYCSSECKIKDNPKSCLYCGEPFIDLSGSGQQYCSSECRYQEYLKRSREKYDPISHKKIDVCKECGKKFSYNTGDISHKKYCHTCAELVRKRRKKEERQRRRARKRNAKTEKIIAKKIFERDNWVCQLCGKKVNSKLEYPHPKSASLDHIIPLAKGGNHIKRNVQLAHFICNSIKSDRGNDQLRLFG